MWNRGGTRNAVLEKAKLQLSGLRGNNAATPTSTTRRDVPNLGMDLLQGRQASIAALSDLSSEDAESKGQDFWNHRSKTAESLLGGGSRFLKKSANREALSSAPSRSSADRTEPQLIPYRNSQSAALSRLSIIEDRIRNRKAKTLEPDANADLSQPPETRSSAQNLEGVLSSAGSRFLKKKSQKDYEDVHLDSRIAPAQAASVKKGVSLDSDEEDMHRLLGESLDSMDGLIKFVRPTETSPHMGLKTYNKSSEKGSRLCSPAKEKPSFSPHQKSPSPSSSPPSSPSLKTLSPGRSRSHHASLSSASNPSEVKSLDELFTVASEDHTLSDQSAASDDFKLNVMMLDNLASLSSGAAKLPQEKADASPAGMSKLSPPPADEILHQEETPVEYESDFEKDVLSEVLEHLSEGDHISVASESQNDQVITDNDQSLSENPSKSTSSHYRRSESCFSPVRASYSSDDATTPSRKRSATPRRRVQKDVSVQAEGEGYFYPWHFGRPLADPSVAWSFVDPARVTAHTISTEAVEALSVHNPAMLALNDMLRQQLTLTRNFIESSRQMHHSTLESLRAPSYKYTTLEDAKELIWRNRSPRLTLEDALEEVLQEMREYHYI